MTPAIKEVIFFSYGDSTKASTWSNVPYLFTRALEEKGIRVRRVRLFRQGPWVWLCNEFIKWIYPLFFPGHAYGYLRTPLYRRGAFRKIRRAVKRYDKADLCIFTCFDFWNPFNGIPTLLFSDWTYEILIAERLKRALYPFEQRYAQWQAEAISSAGAVVSLFPECARSMRERLPAANIHHLGSNVVNNLYDGVLLPEEIIPRKKGAKRLLFIGGRKYEEGCRLLLEAFRRLQKENPEYGLDVIGMHADHFSDVQIPPHVTFHGYLKKDHEPERRRYYELLLNASVFVNPTMVWGGYSSTIEAMFFYTPVIVAPYGDFVAEFGNAPAFGAYNREFSPECLYRSLREVLDNPHYEAMCLEAHRRTEHYTWDNYVDKILKLAQDTTKEQ